MTPNSFLSPMVTQLKSGISAILIREGVAKLKVRRFSGLFWPIFRFFSGGNIRNVDITP
jgi:hypothetical protein